MPTDHRAALREIKTFPQLVAYLRDAMNWPIDRDSFEDVDDLFYDYTAEELGIDAKNSAKIRKIKRLRPLTANQPWGIFFVEFEPKKLPVVALRRILGQVVLKTRTSAQAADRSAWNADDLLFISNYGEGEERQITFAHFSRPQGKSDLPALKVLGWDNLDTAGHLDHVARELTEHLSWPDDDSNPTAWRDQWRSAFTLGHREVITTSKQLSIALAKLAKNIRDRINAALKVETERGPLTKLMNAFRESLLHDLKPDDFADMYAQTIAYGLLSARIADPESKTADDFARHMRTNPFLRELMETFLHVGGRRGKRGDSAIDFDELGVNDVVELLDRANMAAVVADFGDKNPQDDPVIHFYELFLKEYDAKKRMQRGVFYTPRPVVSYIVRSVDELLRTEFSLEDGLADPTTWGEMAKRNKDLKIPEGTRPNQPFVQILDPACGTGTFLVEVIDVVHKTMIAKWKAEGHRDSKITDQWNDYVADFLLPRLHGYELLMAPYAIAHLKIGLKLHETGYQFGSDERARVFLTNALEPPSDIQFRLSAMPALAHESEAVNTIKRVGRFTVVMGNPPYSDSSGNLGPQFRPLVERFRSFCGERIREPGAIRFEHAINNDYVKFWGFALSVLSTSCPGVVSLITSSSFLDGRSFRGVRDSMLEVANTISVFDLHGEGWAGHLIQSGVEDENVFDIQTGVAITTLSRAMPVHPGGRVGYHEHAGTYDQKAALLSVSSAKLLEFEVVKPDPRRYLSFVPPQGASRDEYWQFRNVNDLFIASVDGIKTSRDGLVVANSRAECEAKIQAFRDAKGDADSIGNQFGFDASGFDVAHAQRHLRNHYDEHFVVPFLYRPMDRRFIYYDAELVLSHRMNVMPSMLDKRSLAIVIASRLSSRGFDHAVAADAPCAHKYASHDINSRLFPVIGRFLGPAGDLELASNVRVEEFAPGFTTTTELRDGLAAGAYVYAILNSPKYRERYREQIGQDFPRIPIPKSATLTRGLGEIGLSLFKAHTLSVDPPESIFQVEGRLPVSVSRPKFKQGRIYFNEEVAIGDVTEAIWAFRMAGYDVCRTWFSAGGRVGLARQGGLLTSESVAEFRRVLWSIHETNRLRPEIDVLVEQHGGWPGAFQTASAPVAVAKTPAARLRIVEDPSGEERYRTCVPLVPLKAAATNLDQEPQFIVDNEWQWIEIDTKRRLHLGMFVAEVAGRSMEPAIPDGSFCLFDSPVEGSRQGKTVLVKLHRDVDPESGANYTIKRYESEKVADGDSWRHERITLRPNNPDFAPLVFTEAPDQEFAVIAEFLEVIASPGDEPPKPDGEERAATTGKTFPAAWTAPSKSGAQTQLPMQAPTIRRNVDLSAHGLFRKQETAKPAAGSTNTTAETDDDAEDASPRRSIIDAYETEEVLAIIRDVITTTDPMPREDAVKAIATQLGAGRVGARIRDFIDGMLNTASRRLIIETRDGGLVACTKSIDDYHRDFLKTTLKAVITRTWIEESDALRAATRHLGFRRTGPKIEQSFKSAINGLIRQNELERNGRNLRRAI